MTKKPRKPYIELWSQNVSLILEGTANGAMRQVKESSLFSEQFRSNDFPHLDEKLIKWNRFEKQTKHKLLRETVV